MEKIAFTTTIGKDVEIEHVETVWNVYDFTFKNYPTVRELKKKNPKWVYNIPIAFDIETTNIRMPELKNSYAFMYHWQMCIDDDVVFGRTWDEFTFFIKRMIKEMDLGENHTAIIYSHNLSFEWQFASQFLRTIDENIEPFFVKKRVPLCVRMPDSGIEFRCSYKLSNMSLEKFVKNSFSMYLKKTDVNYDYKRIRTPSTPLTMGEKAYCYCDVRGLCDAIRKELEHGYTIASIPLTSTGYVRRDTLRAFKEYDKFRNGRFANAEWVSIFRRLPNHTECRGQHSFRNQLRMSKINKEIYQQEKDTARGGDTHANAKRAGKVQYNVWSFDRVSSYPAVQMSKKYPSGSWIYHNPKDKNTLISYLDDMGTCTMCTLYLSDLVLKEGVYCPYLPEHKSTAGKNVKCDNGRIYKADGIVIHVTEVDWYTIKRQYRFTIDFWEDVYRCKKDYLPVPLRAVNMYYFTLKCALKNGDKYLYNKSKNKLNAIFGMTYTDIVHDKYLFDMDTLDWSIEKADVEKAIDDYYKKMNSCLRYDVGMYCTAWARWELHLAIAACGTAYIYDDTDSVKWSAYSQAQEKKILEWFVKRNRELEAEAAEAGAVYTDDNGHKYIMGVWESEGEDDKGHPYPLYKRFKTYGAKKYAYDYMDGTFGVTVAGLGKESGAYYISNIDNFTLGFEIPEGKSGRTVSVWTDAPIHTITINGEDIVTASSCAVFDTTYTLGVSGDYEDILVEGELILK